MSAIQSVRFDKKSWSQSEALNWLHDYNMQPIKPVHITTNELRYRMQPPKLFKRFYTVVIPNGVKFIVGSNQKK